MELLKAGTRWLGAAAIAATISLGLGAGAASAQSTWDTIHERGSLRVGVVNAPPWFLKNQNTGEWSGFGPEIARMMADSLDLDLDLVEVEWGTAIPGLLAGKIDVMYFLDPTPERALAVNFPMAQIADVALGVLHNDEVDASTWESLNAPNVSVAVPQGTSMDALVTARLPNAEILRFPSNGESVAAFQSGRANTVALFLPPLTMLQRQVGRGTITLPKPVFSSSNTAAVRREDDGRWLQWVGTAVFFWYNSGTFKNLYNDTLVQLDLDPERFPGVYRPDF